MSFNDLKDKPTQAPAQQPQQAPQQPMQNPTDKMSADKEKSGGGCGC